MADGAARPRRDRAGAIERHGGYVFATGGRRLLRRVLDRRRRGDGRGRVAASSCATTPPSPSPVRMGLHTGEAIERDRQLLRQRGEPRRAADVARPRRSGARVRHDRGAAAQPGRACGPWVSTGSAGSADGCRCTRCGRRAPGRSSPCCAASTTSPATSPQQLSSLVGREQWSPRSPSWCGRSRLVTLTGVGGVGKTRLAARGRRRARRRVPRRRLDGRAGRGRRPGVRARGHRDGAGHHAAGRRCRSIDTVAETLAGRQLLLVVDNCEHVLGRGSSARSERSSVGRARQDPRHVARGPRRRPASRSLTVSPLAIEGGVTLRCRHAVRRPGPRRPARLRAPGPADRRRGDRDLRDPRRAPARHRAGRGAHGRDERGRGPGSARRPVPAVAGRRHRVRSASSRSATPSSGPTTC